MPELFNPFDPIPLSVQANRKPGANLDNRNPGVKSLKQRPGHSRGGRTVFGNRPNYIRPTDPLRPPEPPADAFRDVDDSGMPVMSRPGWIDNLKQDYHVQNWQAEQQRLTEEEEERKRQEDIQRRANEEGSQYSASPSPFAYRP